MRFLLINTDYPAYQRWLYRRGSGLAAASYEDQLAAAEDSLFNVIDFQTNSLRRLGHEAVAIHADIWPLQSAWAREHDLRIPSPKTWHFRLRRRIVPWLSRVESDRWLYRILEAQVDHYRPDVIWVQDLGLKPQFLRKLKSKTGLLIGWHSAPLDENVDPTVFDLVLSSLPNMVEQFQRLGVPADLLPAAFEPAVLRRVDHRPRNIPVSFVGNLFRSHASRRQWLTEVAANTPVSLWCPEANNGAEGSFLHCARHGAAWGIDMYRVLASSWITLNHHIDAAGRFAANLRLFEATGMGALLITDHKDNLGDLFEPGREVVSYRSAKECAELISYYLTHDAEREAIAKAGQARTLREHTYDRRMQQFVDLLAGRHVAPAMDTADPPVAARAAA